MSGVSLIDGHIDNLRDIDLWIGLPIYTGDNSNAALYLGTYKARNLPDAVQQWVAENPQKRECYVDILHLTYWHCKFYDNEADARQYFR